MAKIKVNLNSLSLTLPSGAYTAVLAEPLHVATSTPERSLTASVNVEGLTADVYSREPTISSAHYDTTLVATDAAKEITGIANAKSIDISLPSNSILASTPIVEISAETPVVVSRVFDVITPNTASLQNTVDVVTSSFNEDAIVELDSVSNSLIFGLSFARNFADSFSLHDFVYAGGAPLDLSTFIEKVTQSIVLLKQDTITPVETLSASVRPAAKLDNISLSDTIGVAGNKGTNDVLLISEDGHLYLQDYFLEDYYIYPQEYTLHTEENWPGSVDYMHVSELFSAGFSTNFADSYNVSDVVLLRPNSVRADTTTFSEDLIRNSRSLQEDSVGFLEVLPISLRRFTNENLFVIETINRQFGRPFSDITIISENLQTAFGKATNEIITTAETYHVNFRKSQTDSFNTNETTTSFTRKVLVESQQFAEIVVKQPGLSRVDTLSFPADTLYNHTTKSLSDDLTLYESYRAAEGLKDLAGFSEDLVYTSGKALDYVVYLPETMILSVKSTLVEQTTLLEVVQKTSTGFASDVFNLKDSGHLYLQDYFLSDYSSYVEEYVMHSQDDWPGFFIDGVPFSETLSIAGARKVDNDLFTTYESLGIFSRKYLSENLAVIESFSSDFIKINSDNLAIAEVLSSKSNKAAIDTVTTNETLYSAFAKVNIDILAAVETLTSYLGKPLIDATALVENIGIHLGSLRNDTITTQEFLELHSKNNSSDITSVLEVVSAKVSPNTLTSIGTLSEIVLLRARPERSDTVSLQEYLRYNSFKVNTEVLSINETIAAKSTRPLSEIAQILEVISVKTLPAIFSDLFSVNESISTKPIVNANDTTTLTEVVLNRPNKVNVDVVSCAEVITSKSSIVNNDILSNQEYLRFNTARVTSEVLTPIEYVGRHFKPSAYSESFGVIDTATSRARPVYSDVSSMSESVIIKPRPIISDTLSSVETRISAIKPLFAESISTIETIVIRPRPLVSEACMTYETILTHSKRVSSDITSVYEVITLKPTKLNSDIVSSSESFVISKQDYFSQDYVRYSDVYNSNYFYQSP